MKGRAAELEELPEGEAMAAPFCVGTIRLSQIFTA
jgi:hypothetical protein